MTSQGVISGTPTLAGTFTFTATATFTILPPFNKIYTIVVSPSNLTRNQTATSRGLGTQGSNFIGNLPPSAFGTSLDQVAPNIFFSNTEIPLQNILNMNDQLTQQLSQLRNSFTGSNGNLAFLFKQGFKELDSFADNTKSPTATDVNLNKGKAQVAVDKKLAKEDDRKWSVFANAYGLFNDVESERGQSGYQSTTAGALFGFNYKVLKNLIAGAHTGFSFSDVDHGQWDSSSKLSSFNVGAQTTYFTHNGLYIDALFDYGFNKYETKRRIFLPGFDARAKSDTDGNQISAHLGGGWEKKIGNWTLGPDGALEYSHVDVDGFTEKGASFFNLHVDDDSAESLKFRVGGRVAHTTHFGWGTLVPDLKLQYIHEFLNNDRSIGANFADVGATPFTFRTSRVGRDSSFFGAGLTANVHQNISVYVHYDAELFKDKQQTQSVFGGIRIRF